MNLDDISLFQCKFQTIHPFLDGNGRIGRMIMLKQCLINNIALFVITSDDKNEFINCLNLYRKTNSELFLSKFLTQLQKIFLFKYSNFLTSSQDIRWIEILKLLEKNTYINRKNIETLFNIKEGQAKKILSKLIKENKIRKIGNTNGSVYTLL
jgi:Fic family protein